MFSSSPGSGVGNVGRWVPHTEISGTGTKRGADVHGAQGMNPNDFGDLLSFPLAPPWGSHMALSHMFPQHLDGFLNSCHEICCTS